MSNFSMPSASDLERALQCPASAVLPRIDRQSAKADQGAFIHEFIDKALTEGRDKALAWVETVRPRMLPRCTKIKLDQLKALLSDQFETELAMAYDAGADSARVIGHHIERDYGELGPLEFACTADIVNVNRIIEIKTGSMPVTAADSNPQLMLQSLALLRARDYGSIVGIIATLADSGEFSFDSTEYSMMRLDWVADRLCDLAPEVNRVRLQVINGETPQVNPTDYWCKYCPCIATCPAKKAA